MRDDEHQTTADTGIETVADVLRRARERMEIHDVDPRDAASLPDSAEVDLHETNLSISELRTVLEGRAELFRCREVANRIPWPRQADEPSLDDLLDRSCRLTATIDDLTVTEEDQVVLGILTQLKSESETLSRCVQDAALGLSQSR